MEWPKFLKKHDEMYAMAWVATHSKPRASVEIAGPILPTKWLASPKLYTSCPNLSSDLLCNETFGIANGPEATAQQSQYKYQRLVLKQMLQHITKAETTQTDIMHSMLPCCHTCPLPRMSYRLRQPGKSCSENMEYENLKMIRCISWLFPLFPACKFGPGLWISGSKENPCNCIQSSNLRWFLKYPWLGSPIKPAMLQQPACFRAWVDK